MDRLGDACHVGARAAAALRHQPFEVGRADRRFAARIGPSRSGRLRFTNGAHGVVIGADAALQELYSARFADRVPMVDVRGGVVSVCYLRSCDRFGGRVGDPAEISLSTRVPWTIEVRGGASGLVVDLRGLRLRRLGLAGGAGRVRAVLPEPSGTVPVAILGGASDLVVRLPERVPTRLRVEGGATNLLFDDRRISVTGRDLDLRSRDYDAAVDRYDVLVTGGANDLRVLWRGSTQGIAREVSA